MAVEPLLYSALSALAGGRVYPLKMPQDPTYPAITYQRVSGTRPWTLAGQSALQNPRFQIDVWAKGFSEARALAEQVRVALKTPTGFKVGDYSDQDVYEATVDVYRVMIQVSLWHVEDPAP